MGDDPRIPNWEEDGYITERMTDLLTFIELRQLVKPPPESLPDSIKKKIKDMYKNLISIDQQSTDTIKEAGKRIISIIKDHLSQEAYLNELSRFRNLRQKFTSREGHSYPLVVRSSWQVSKLKILIEQLTKENRETLRLFYKGQELRNDRTLEAEGVRSLV